VLRQHQNSPFSLGPMLPDMRTHPCVVVPSLASDMCRPRLPLGTGTSRVASYGRFRRIKAPVGLDGRWALQSVSGPWQKSQSSSQLRGIRVDIRPWPRAFVPPWKSSRSLSCCCLGEAFDVTRLGIFSVTTSMGSFFTSKQACWTERVPYPREVPAYSSSCPTVAIFG
jgi:hypothetical protein